MRILGENLDSFRCNCRRSWAGEGAGMVGGGRVQNGCVVCACGTTGYWAAFHNSIKQFIQAWFYTVGNEIL